ESETVASGRRRIPAVQPHGEGRSPDRRIFLHQCLDEFLRRVFRKIDEGAIIRITDVIERRGCRNNRCVLLGEDRSNSESEQQSRTLHTLETSNTQKQLTHARRQLSAGGNVPYSRGNQTIFEALWNRGYHELPDKPTPFPVRPGVSGLSCSLWGGL